MKALVTGAAGFIGSHLVDFLVEQGHQVRGIDNFIRGKREYVNPKCDFFAVDIRDKNIDKYMRGVDWVFHLAAIATTPWAIRDPKLTNDINVTGTLNLLLAAKKQMVKRFIYSSSNVVYSPKTPYFVSKKAGEHYAKVFNSLYNLSTISLRYSNVYGSLRASPENCIMAMRKSWLENGFVTVTGNGLQTRDFSHVLDVARANLLAAQSSFNGQIDICTGKNTSILEIARSFNCQIKHVPDRPGDIMHIHQNPLRAKKLIEYTSTYLLKNNLMIYTKR